MSAPRAGGRLAVLDGLRGMAIVMVLLVHFVGDDAPHGPVEHAIVKLANYGVWGVDLFFVLSGFLITGILFDARRSPRYFRDFYVRRTLRIFPLYYGVLALLFLVLPNAPLSYPEELAASARHQAWLWGYGTNFYVASKASWALPYVSHFWSLAVEEHFYLLWPWVVWTFPIRTLMRICLGAMVFSLGLRCVLSASGASEVALVALTPCRLDALCLGGLLALAVRSRGLDDVARLGALAAPAAFALVFALSWVHATTGSALRHLVLPLRSTVVAMSFGALLVWLLAAPRTSWPARLFHARPMRLLGTYSYGLYVFHGIIAYGMQAGGTAESIARRLGSTLAAMGVNAAAGTVVSLAVAIASYEGFEKHFLRLKDRLAGAPASG